MELTLGWKDILRPIRDGFRHLFPSPDTGPTPEERARQRKLDRLKGFTYFDTFQELEAWTEGEAIPVQRANTPLLPRSRRLGEGGESRARVLLCHDYAGNYHVYEASQGVGVDVKSYFCEHLQFVDTFIYFSHKLVCVPPPSWTNALHRNGVCVLGTLLLERQTRDVERLLQRTLDYRFPLATVLASVARCYGFDGWLVNVEKPFAIEQWEPEILEAFLKQLRQELGPGRKLIWYDALTKSNVVSYQNALSALNLPFSQACGAILTNYTWEAANAQDSKALALDSGMDPESVYMGIDVWAQNTTKLSHPRTTYPRKGGGGTHTGVAVAKVAEIGVSAAVFGPAWSYEHFPGHEVTADLALWEGHDLPRNLDCPCGRASERHPSNPGSPIVRFAREFAAGSDRYFYTDFSRGFGSHSGKEASRLYDDKGFHSQLGSQSILPYTGWRSIKDADAETGVNVLSMYLKDVTGASYLVVQVLNPKLLTGDKDLDHESWLPLFKLDMPVAGSLRFRFQYRYMPPHPNATACFYLKFEKGVSLHLLSGGTGVHQMEGAVQQDSICAEPNRLVELGIYLKAPTVDATTSLMMVELTETYIGPTVEMHRACGIENVRAEHRADDEDGPWRLCWEVYDENEEALVAAGVPYSQITGPFAYFLVNMDGTSARAYALEWIICPSMLDVLLDRMVEVSITGVGFDGQHLSKCSLALQIPRDVMIKCPSTS